MTVGPGTTLSHFKILAKIGEGGMGVVYRAEDEKLRRPVALKVLPPDLVANEERRLRFLREARTAAAINHTNIATIYEVDEADGVVFIAMELVEGKTLREVMGGKPMSIKDTLRIATEISEGLAKAHGAHVIHRDLKPENVIVTPDGHVKILDFGLAKLLREHSAESATELSKLSTISEELTIQGKIFGTVSYMSPEQARGQTVDARSDLFSFGTTLYEMLTGRVPFQGKTATDTLSSIIRDEPTPPSQLNDTVPQELDRIVAGCLEKDPQDRYQHTDQLAVDLRKLKRATDSGVQAVRTPSGPLPVAPTGRLRVVRWVKRHPKLTAALGIALVVAAVGTWRATRPEVGFRSGDRIIVADFENTTGNPEFDTAISDIFEDRLSYSWYIEVIGGEDLEALQARHTGGSVTRLDRDLVGRICREGGCDGYLLGSIGTESGGYRLQVSLQRAGRKDPVTSQSSIVPTESDLLLAIHEMSLDIRRALRESPQSMADPFPPTTDSITAFHLYSIASWVNGTEAYVSLLKEALDKDPNFVEAYSALANSYWNLGNRLLYRQAITEAYQRSGNLSDRQRSGIEKMYLESLYEFDAVLEKLKGDHWRYPLRPGPSDYMSTLYLLVYEDPILGEQTGRDAWARNGGGITLLKLGHHLTVQGKADELEQVIQEARRRGIPEAVTELAMMDVHMLRGDWAEIEEAIEKLGAVPGNNKEWAMKGRLNALLARGHLERADEAAAAYWRAAGENQSRGGRFWASMVQGWLRMRRTGRAPLLSPEQTRFAEADLLVLRREAPYFVESGLAELLEKLIQHHATIEKDSKSRFVLEELQFARGCLELIRGNLEGATEMVKPLAGNSNLHQRHMMLGRIYEAREMWREAATEYEEAMRNPHEKWSWTVNAALWVLGQFRLAKVYDKLDDTDRARQWYERFTDDWKDADPDIPELIEARERLAELTATVTSSKKDSDSSDAK